MVSFSNQKEMSQLYWCHGGVMKLFKKSSERSLPLVEREDPQLYRELYPYTKIGRIGFDDTIIAPRPADPCFITDKF